VTFNVGSIRQRLSEYDALICDPQVESQKLMWKKYPNHRQCCVCKAHANCDVCPLGNPGQRKRPHCEHKTMDRLSAAITSGSEQEIVDEAVERLFWLVERMKDNGITKKDLE